MEITTTITIIPPHHVQAVAVPLIQQYAPQGIVHIQAHISVLIPFAPLPDLPPALEKLAALCATIQPFEVTLKGYNWFPEAVYMDIEHPEPLLQLGERIHHAFPEYPLYEGLYGTAYHPHLTIAFVKEGINQDTVKLPDYNPLTFTVERLHIETGIRNQIAVPWITHDVVWLKR